MLPFRRFQCFALAWSLLWATGAVAEEDFDARVPSVLNTLYHERSSARQLGRSAEGILVFPTVLKAGVGIGAEFGKGALLVDDVPVQYYRLTALSYGLQLGGQARSQVIMFMSEGALTNFMRSDGWEAGVDGSITVITFGVGKEVDTHSARNPIVAFVFDSRGLMYNLSLEGAKFWKIDP
jgi:lipid-binding SYLF domain-containing protein